jgi:hypothetical protein
MTDQEIAVLGPAFASFLGRLGAGACLVVTWFEFRRADFLHDVERDCCDGWYTFLALVIGMQKGVYPQVWGIRPEGGEGAAACSEPKDDRLLRDEAQV